MVVARANRDRVVLADLEDVLAVLGMAEALRVGETIVVDLRLRVMVRRVTRPAAGQRDDFAQHEAHFGRRVVAVAIRNVEMKP